MRLQFPTLCGGWCSWCMVRNNVRSPITPAYIGASILALLFGFSILLMSFRTFNLGREGESLDVKDQRPLAKLLEKRIVPGHPIYLILMARDQVQLFITKEPKDRSRLMIEYARDRLLSAIDLYSAGERQLALATLMKAEVYLGRSADELLKTRQGDESLSQEDLQALLTAIDIHVESLKNMKDTFTDSEKVQGDQLLNYTMSLRDSLMGFSRTSFLEK